MKNTQVNEVGVLSKLKSLIREERTIEASLAVAEYFGDGMDVDHYLRSLEAMARCPKQCSVGLSEQEHLNQFCRYFYQELAFTRGEGDMFQSKYSLLSNVLDYRTGLPLSLAVLFCHLGRLEGLNLSGINFPGHFLVQYTPKRGEPSYIDPLSGNALGRQELEELYHGVMGEDEDEMSEDALLVATTEELVVRLLRNLKAAYLQESEFEKALQCIELLVEFCPDDPYERRDRGFLLQQLDCQEGAVADYRYYIQQCPRDPAAQLLKIRLRHLEPRPQVLH